LLQLASENHITQDVLYKEAKDILDEMAHNLSMKATRGFAFALIKVFKALFNRVYVNEDGIQMVRGANICCFKYILS
jgi:glycerone phosphate O-acyltransferase